MKYISHFFLLLTMWFLFTVTSQAQSLLDISNHADCANPMIIDITQKIIGPTTVPKGYGQELEFSGNPMKDLKYIEKEHNTVWYRFEVPFDGQLVFELIPTSKNNDYDFMLFQYTNEQFCEDVKAKQIPPARTNISRNDKSIDSKTGLSYTSTNRYQHSGIGTDYSQFLTVQKGQIYYLLVDNVYPKGQGHTLVFDYKIQEKEQPKQVVTAKPKYLKELPVIGIVKDMLTNENLEAKVTFSLIGSEEIIKEMMTEEQTGKFVIKEEIDLRGMAQEKYSLKVEKEGYLTKHIKLKPKDIPNFIRRPMIIKLSPIHKAKEVRIVGEVRDTETNEPLKAEVNLLNAETGEVISQVFSDSLTGQFQLKPLIDLQDNPISKYALEIYKDQYFFSSVPIDAKELPTISRKPFRTKIPKLKKGELFRIDNINFYGDSPKPLPRSEYVFKVLKKFMKRNKSLIVKIEGHTNGCHSGRNFSRKLSEARCKTVVDYLITKQIDAERLEYEGFACDRMLYPRPRTALENQLNRRVEIRILDY